MISPETLYMKNSVNECSFPLVIHTAYFDTWFGHYGLLKLGYGTDHILDRLVIQVIDQVLGPQEARRLSGLEHGF
jgi:hypothetical protein